MALILLQVLVLGVIAAAADDAPLTWYWSGRGLVPCSLPGARVLPRRPPPPLDAERARPQRGYSWRRDGEEYPPHRVFSNGTLDVRRSEGRDGVYQCSARTQQGVVLGYPVHLQTAHLDKFSVHPENTTAPLGQPVALSCVISSSPPAVVSWLRDGQSLPADDRYYLLKNQLLITDVRQTDVGLYRCRATNTFLNKSTVSHGGRLHVGPSEPREPEFLATFEERELAAPGGTSVLLPCPVLGWPRPEITWELVTEGGYTSVLDGGDQVLVVQKEGVYTCRVRDRSNFEKTFNVTVTQSANITKPPSSKQAPRASTVRLACSAQGRPAPNITWYKDGVPLALTGRIGLRKSPDEERIELVISSVTSDDAGIYQCFASNSFSSSSAWAAVGVTGADAAPPHRVTCEPVGAREVAVRWLPAQEPVVAYTVHTTRQDKPGSSLPGQPHKNTQEIVTVAEALTPYKFQVRAYIQSMKNMATDFSEGVVCQGQGVPIKLVKLDTNSVLVSWQKFSTENPGVVEWLLQSRFQDADLVQNVTLDADATNYTLTIPSDGILEVRVLGTRSLPWLQQNLTHVPWYSATDSGDGVSAPRDLEVTQITAHGFSMRWETDQPQKHFLVCVTKVEGIEECQLSDTNSITIENLQPSSEYEVRVQTKVPGREAAEATLSYHVVTIPEGPHHFKDVTHKFINASTLRVSWGGAPGRYAVKHTSDVHKPIEQWSLVTTMGNTVLITGVQPGETTFLMVTGFEPPAQSQIITVPPIINNEPDAVDLSYVYTSNGVTVSWSGVGPRVVRFAQNITRPLEAWRVVNVTENHVQLAGLDASLPTFVTVTAPGSGRPSQVLTIPARPHDVSAISIGVGVGCLVCVLLLLAVAAFCIWRKRKIAQSPARSRRRNVSPTEGHEGESSEMKML
ncbi:protogenin-like isoform X2 [Choristoneura fumiferana]|uniref:protogenin-like isoform X2 n=1 Tax=Choristoneura fumiferana TaxID=7141 RepID=UPI003D154453